MNTIVSDESPSLSYSDPQILIDARSAYEQKADNLKLFDKYAQLLIKHQRIEAAESLLKNASLMQRDCVESRIVHAHLLYKMKKYDELDLMFNTLIQNHPENIKARIVYAQILKKRKKLILAYEMVKPLDSHTLDQKQLPIYEEIIDLIRDMENKEGRPIQADDDFCLLAMKHAILHFKKPPEGYSFSGTLGKISLITGSLGPGGAERQVCLTAIHINKKMKAQQKIGQITVTKEVDVLINAYDTDKEKSFFLPLLQQHAVRLFQIKDLPSVPLEQLAIESKALLQLLNESPSMVRYGLHHLVEYYRQAKTEIAFIWQDGASLFATIAALVAKVPKIILNFRGYPPSMRPHLFKAEYYPFYKALAFLPQVSFVTNTKVTAKAYADWLAIADEKFRVIYNGIVPPETLPNDADEAQWTQFAAQTQDATETVGGVFRFETDKRPILVIRLIKRYIQKHPGARFILVGEGRLRQQCMALAEELGIANKILFTGLSKSVGYWMSKMEAMVLMSLFEGLPNVLIEAQYMGVPVISTPAGGAQECFIEGETGFVLRSASEPDLVEACDKIDRIISLFKSNPELKAKAISYASRNFSISGMIENTVKTFTQ